MGRQKTFVLSVRMSNEFYRADRQVAEHLAQSMLRMKSDEPLTGPRGGRYAPIGLPYDTRSGSLGTDDYIQDWITFTAKQRAQYVRPRR